MKSILTFGLAAALWAAPATYTVLKLPAATAPVMDGSLSDWPSAYLLGTITGDENVLARDATTPLNPATEWNGELYAAWDDQWLYFAVKVTVDDNVKSGIGYEYDGFKLNPGGQAAAFYIWNAPLGTACPSSTCNPQIYPSCPYSFGSTLFAGINVNGNGIFPTVEFKIQKNMLDPFGLMSFQFSVGVEETDGPGTADQHYIGFGVEYTGPKDYSGSSWDNVLYYPTYNLSNTQGPGGTPDTIAPVISNVAASSNSATAASVWWNTSELATSRVIFGTSGVFFSSQSMTGVRTSHAVTLTGLIGGTIYNFKAISADASGNTDTSGVYYVTTRSAPVFVSSAATMDTMAAEGILYSDQAMAADADSGDFLTFSLLTPPSGMLIGASTGGILWTPSSSQSGRFTVRVRAVDKYGMSDTLTYYITVANVNDPPVIASSKPSGDTTITEGDTLLMSVTATDADAGDVLSFFWFRNGTLSGNASSFLFGTGQSSAGADSVRVLVFDGKAQTEKKWTITILNRSTPPKILFPSNGKVLTGDSLLGWEPSPDLEFQGPQQYRLQFSKSSAFADSVRIEGGIPTTAVRIRDLKSAPLLPAGFILFWRVMASDSAGYATVYSAPGYFVYLGAGNGVEAPRGAALPASFSLAPLSPNPVRSGTRIRFAVPPKAGRLDARPVSLRLFSVRGGLVRTLVQGRSAPGFHDVDFDGRSLAAGIYLLRLEAQGFLETRVLAVVK